MWTDGFDSGPTGRSPNQDQGDPDFGGLLTAGLALGLATLVAAVLPPPLVAPVMKELLLLSASGAALIASLRQERVFANRITAWDQAAVLAFVGLLCGLFVDPEAVSQALGQITGQTMAPAA